MILWLLDAMFPTVLWFLFVWFMVRKLQPPSRSRGPLAGVCGVVFAVITASVLCTYAVDGMYSLLVLL
jgi:hypothetical protein